MKSNILKRIDDFTNRHLLLSSFVCLISLSVVLNSYMGYALPSPLLPEGIERIINLAVYTLFIGTIPIFFIAILVCRFIKKENSAVPNLTYYRKFFLSFVPTLAIILFFLIRVAQYASGSYHNPSYPYHLAILTSSVYSVIFAAFFSWASKASKFRIVVQCIITSILMGFFGKVIYSIATWEIGA